MLAAASMWSITLDLAADAVLLQLFFLPVQLYQENSCQYYCTGKIPTSTTVPVKFLPYYTVSTAGIPTADILIKFKSKQTTNIKIIILTKRYPFYNQHCVSLTGMTIRTFITNRSWWMNYSQVCTCEPIA